MILIAVRFSKTLILLLSLALAGCLKTRTTVKDDTTEKDIDNGQKSAKNKPVGRYEIEEIKNEVTRVTGRMDEIDHMQRSQLSTDLRESVTKLDARVVELEKNQILLVTELKELKDNRLAADGGKANAAPKTRKELAEQHFLNAESHFENEEYKKAIVEYSKVQETFSKSPRIPTSLFKIGKCFDRLGMQKEAEGFYSELQEKYPLSPEVRKMKTTEKNTGKNKITKKGLKKKSQ